MTPVIEAPDVAPKPFLISWAPANLQHTINGVNVLVLPNTDGPMLVYGVSERNARDIFIASYPGAQVTRAEEQTSA